MLESYEMKADPSRSHSTSQSSAHEKLEGQDAMPGTSTEQAHSNGVMGRSETHHEDAAQRAKKEDLSRIESEVVYPKGLAIAMIMISLYLAVFLIAIVSEKPFPANTL